LDDPVLHRRRLDFDKQSMRIEVRDALECGGEHLVEIYWHLAECCIAKSSGHSVHVQCAGLHMQVECPRELDTPTVVVGQDDPPLGWVSRRFDHKTPSPVIVCKGRIVGNTSLVTAITFTIGAVGAVQTHQEMGGLHKLDSPKFDEDLA
jgi:hypothetical protein